MFNNMCRSIIKSHRIVTTTAKAKELRRFIEPMITRAKEDTPYNRSIIFRSLRDEGLVEKLFEEIAPLFERRKGGYTRVLKLGAPRAGDKADMALIEFVEELETDTTFDFEDDEETEVDETVATSEEEITTDEREQAEDAQEKTTEEPVVKDEQLETDSTSDQADSAETTEEIEDDESDSEKSKQQEGESNSDTTEDEPPKK